MTTVYMRDLDQYTRTGDCRTSNNNIYGAHKKYVNKEILNKKNNFHICLHLRWAITSSPVLPIHIVIILYQVR